MEKTRNNERIRQRVSSACDACRSRKIKCVVSDEGSKCSACSELRIECTSVRPRKKRGPKNRYAQILRAQLDGESVWDSTQGQHDLSLIAPHEVLHRIIEDWFDCIDPVAPVFERKHFEQQVNESATSSRTVTTSFLLLVASICAATIASLRRRRHRYGSVTPETCLDLAERLKLWSTTSSITVTRALTVYNFSSAMHHEHGVDSPLAFRLNGEACTDIRYLIDQRLDHLTFNEQQTLKRLYWLAFAAQCTGELHGRRMAILHQAHEPWSSLLPEAVPNSPVSPITELSCTQTGSLDYTYVPGLVALSRLFLVWQSSQAIMVQTLENLHTHISQAHKVLDCVAPELRWQDNNIGGGHFGYDVQRVNLKVTQLHVRSNLLEQMNTLAKNHELLVTPDAIIQERRLVVDELLDVLYKMPEEVFDANGYSIISKIRDIGGALLDELRTGDRDSSTLQASVNMDRLLAKLEHLDIRVETHASHV